MATTIGIVKSATETILGIGEVSIDNFTFKLFYKWSVSLFVAGSVAVCSSQFFGDPISCETVSNDTQGWKMDGWPNWLFWWVKMLKIIVADVLRVTRQVTNCKIHLTVSLFRSLIRSDPFPFNPILRKISK